MTNRVLCGFHALKDKDNSAYYPVCVYFKYENKMAHRETGLVINEAAASLHDCLDTINDAIEYSRTSGKEQMTGIEYSESELEDVVILDPLTVKYPPREMIGKNHVGYVVGWHVDLKTNSRSKTGVPHLIANLAWMDVESDTVHYIIIDKMPVIAKNGEDLSIQVHKMFKAMNDVYVLGGVVNINVVPQGKHNAKYSLVEYTRPQTISEVICNALQETLNADLG